MPGIKVDEHSTAHPRLSVRKVSSYRIPTIERCDKNIWNQLLASSFCNINVMVACAGFTFLEPLTVWLTTDDSEIKMTTSDISWLSAAIEIGELLVGIPSGIFADMWGRKSVILSVGPIGVVTYLLAIFTRNIPAMYVIRVLQGATLGISMTVTPTYIAEISSPEIRGALGGFTIVAIYVGFTYSFCAGHYLNYQNYLYSLAAMPVVLLLTFLFVPESPYYYYMKNNDIKAFKALVWLRGGRKDSLVVREAANIQQSVQSDMKRKSDWKDLMATKSNRRAMLIVQTVNIATYMTGVQSIVMYAEQTFMSTPLLWVNSVQLTIAMGIALCLSAFVASFVADTVGRRNLLLISSVGITLSNLTITIYYYLAEKTSIEVTSLAWVLYVGIFGLCVMTNIGVGELVHTMQGEFFPSHTRSLAGGVTSAVGAVAIFASVKLYQPLIDYFGVYMNFALYTVIAMLTFIIILIYMTESAGKTLSQVNQDLRLVVHETDLDGTL